MMARPPLQRGFSLLEVLVAFSVLAIALAIIFQLVGTSLRNAAASDEYGQAVVVAESVLARVGREWAVDGGGMGGDDAGYRWQLEVAPFGDNSGLLPLYEVVVVVSWDNGSGGTRSLTLHSLRLGEAQL